VGGVQEYLLLQSLLAIWPLDEGAADQDELRRRMEEYAVKAAREAKESTSWLEADGEYERVLRAYVSVLLPQRAGRGFRRYFEPVVDRVLYFGLLNSLATLVLKLTVPGVPDIYQGNELPAFVLVDPDNRHAPDYTTHDSRLERMLQALDATSPRDFLRASIDDWRQGDLKLYLTWRLLELRRQHAGLFESGDYTPLAVNGGRSNHLCAFVRRAPGCTLIVLVSRWGATLGGGKLHMPTGEEAWFDTRVLLPPDIPAGDYQEVICGRGLRIEASAAGERAVAVAEVFDLLPFSVLIHEDAPVNPATRTTAVSGP
jgi:(1->4)-alpha-D-glucan 1-alpha-D-glucosylmutase